MSTPRQNQWLSLMTDRPKPPIMRVAYFVRVFPKLSETFVLNQITGVIDRGHDVSIFAFDRDESGASHPSIARHQLLKKTRYLSPHSAAGRMFTRSLWELIGGLTQRTPRLIHALLKPGMGYRWLNPTVFYSALPFLRGPIHDIAHFQFGYVAMPLLPLIRHRVIQGRIVVSLRGNDLFKVLRGNAQASTAMIRSVDLFLPVSNSLRDGIIALGAPAARVRVLHSGIRLDQFAFQPRSRAPHEPIRIVSVGRLVPKKGFDQAIEAVASLIRSGHNVFYNIIGSGRLQPELEQKIAELALGDRIQLLGSQPHEKVVEIMQSRHILLAPSVTAPDGDQEGIPNVLKEAMAMGMPVVSTRHSGIPELVEHGISGYLAPEGDVPALTTELGRLINQSERWGSMGAAGRKRVELEFDSTRLNDELLGIYEQLRLS
jgi:colanic acid/amylovoran biosynthesis glycosyltransferase